MTKTTLIDVKTLTLLSKLGAAYKSSMDGHIDAYTQAADDAQMILEDIGRSPLGGPVVEVQTQHLTLVPSLDGANSATSSTGELPQAN